MVESNVFSAWIGVFTGLTSASVRMHRKRASRSRFVKDAASFGSSPRADKVQEKIQIHPCRSRALRSIAPEAGLECSSSDEDEVSPEGKCRCNF